MAKSSEEAPKTVQRGAYICSGCKTEFEGTACPECGNIKGNMKLASDGIEHEIHKTGHLFSGANLRPAEDFTTEAQRLEKKRASMQMEEMDDNLREAYVLKSKLKLHDLEMQTRRKEIERKKLEEQSEEYMTGRSTIPPSQTGQGSGQQDGSQFGGGAIPNMPFMQPLSPQAIFMQQLMRMDGKKRAEFIEQLTDADPGAMANLAAMFQEAAPRNQYPPANAYSPDPYGRYAMMSPWMQQPAPQPQQHQTDPIALVTAIFELSQKMQPQRDDSMKESLQEFKGAIQKVHDRIDTVVSKERDKDMSPILEKISSLEQKLNSGSGRPSVVDQVTELTQLVDGLEKVGLVTRSGRADKSVDDELKIKEFEFKKDMETKKMDHEDKKIEAEQSKANLTQSIVSSLLQRGLQKGLKDREDENPSASSSQAPQRVNRVRTVQTPPPAPVEIIDEVQSDAGIVRETRRPVKRVDTGVT
jgi:hypothetical protein